MSAQTNKPMMGIVYDSLSGAYLLTSPEYEYEKLTAEIPKLENRIAQLPGEIDTLRVRISGLDPSSNEYKNLQSKIESLVKETQTLPLSLAKIRTRLEIVRERIMLDPVVFNQAISYVADTEQFVTLRDRLHKYGVPWGSGRSLFSSVLPADFDYSIKIKDNEVIIKEGVLIKGLVTKDIIGNKDGSVIAEMVKQLGGTVTGNFMSELQFIIREFLQQRGFSVGIDDCIPNDPEFRRLIDESLTNAQMKVIALTGTATNRLVAEQQERKIVETLENVKSQSDKLVQQRLHPDNAILIMANSGAKGTTYNAVQMSSLLGSQKVSGQRIPANLPGNRSLPVFKPNDPDPRARGFCVNSFGTGLTPSEFFFHAQGGREGLTDTAVNTAQTGFLQHQIIKSAEDIHISPDGSVRSADNAIIQFIYGDDGFDASQLGTVKIREENIPFFRNIEQLASKINRKYSTRIQ